MNEQPIAFGTIILHDSGKLKCYKHNKNIFADNVAIIESKNLKLDYLFNDSFDVETYEIIYEEEKQEKKEKQKSSNIINQYKNTKKEKQIHRITMTNLFKKYNITYIDLLFINDESLNIKMIESIDFNLIHIDKIYIEKIKQVDIHKYAFLEQRKYKIRKNLQQNTYDMVAIKKKDLLIGAIDPMGQ